MYRVLEATCHNGNLILSEKLPDSMEGRKIRIVLIEEDDIERKKKNFLELLDKHSFELPEKYKFNRDELYER